MQARRGTTRCVVFSRFCILRNCKSLCWGSIRCLTEDRSECSFSAKGPRYFGDHGSHSLSENFSFQCNSGASQPPEPPTLHFRYFLSAEFSVYGENGAPELRRSRSMHITTKPLVAMHKELKARKVESIFIHQTASHSERKCSHLFSLGQSNPFVNTRDHNEIYKWWIQVPCNWIRTKVAYIS